jgi:alcohol dehydrogenase class IV
MVNSFQFARVPGIIFKNGAAAGLPLHVRSFGTRIALVTGKGSFLHSPAGEKLLADFEREKISFQIITVPSEPSPEFVDQAVRSLNDKDIDLIVGIGGGSALDAGKAISAMIYKSEPVIKFLEGVGNAEHPGTKLPYIAIPTTSGTGSEATKNAVLSRTGINGFKKSLRHDNFVPDLALVDPLLTLSCPSDITAAGGMDCFTQLTEAYLSDKAGNYTDAFALEGLKAIKLSLVRACANGQDIEARTGMSFAALTSGICLANAGLGVVHGFASSAGGMFTIPHGVLCGTLMAKANEINVRELRKKPDGQTALNKYSILGRLFLVEQGKSSDYYIEGFIEHLHRLTDDLDLPLLGKYGVSEKDIEQVCAGTENKNNPVKLNRDKLAEIISARL